MVVYWLMVLYWFVVLKDCLSINRITWWVTVMFEPLNATNVTRSLRNKLISTNTTEYTQVCLWCLLRSNREIIYLHFRRNCFYVIWGLSDFNRNFCLCHFCRREEFWMQYLWRKLLPERSSHYAQKETHRWGKRSKQESFSVGCVPRASVATTRCRYQWLLETTVAGGNKEVISPINSFSIICVVKLKPCSDITKFSRKCLPQIPTEIILY